MEAEFYDPYADKEPLVMQLVRAMAAFRSETSLELAEAIANERPWSNGKWSLAKDPHPSGIGYDLRLKVE